MSMPLRCYNSRTPRRPCRRIPNRTIKWGSRRWRQVTSVAESWLLLGRFYLLMKRLPEAESQFKKATEVAPKNAVAWMDLGRAQYANGRKEDAEKTFRRV